MHSLRPSDLGDSYQPRVTTQRYGGKAHIEGVRFLELSQAVDDGGDFMELARLDEAGGLLPSGDLPVRQVNYSRVLPGAIKAFHLHYNQEDVWFVPPSDRLLVGLVDLRRSSATHQQNMRFVLGGGTTRMVYIPRGIAHGAANPWSETAQILYFVNQHFSAAEPDEHRLPWDLCGADFWRIQPG
ncbi:MAG: dTDP-4-dehydrorhamnose 3,5-epimerase family protein [Chloroflexota bacterium]